VVAVCLGLVVLHLVIVAVQEVGKVHQIVRAEKTQIFVLKISLHVR